MGSAFMSVVMATCAGCVLSWLLGRFLGWGMSGAETAPMREFLMNLGVLPRPRPAPDAATQVLMCELELRRLSQLVQDTDATDQPHKFERLQASRAAYDNALLHCCQLVSVDVPYTMPPLSPAKRLEAEMALMAAGVDW